MLDLSQREAGNIVLATVLQVYSLHLERCSSSVFLVSLFSRHLGGGLIDTIKLGGSDVADSMNALNHAEDIFSPSIFLNRYSLSFIA